MRPSDQKIILFTGVNKSELIESLINEGYNLTAIVVPKSNKYRVRYSQSVLTAAYHNISVICVNPNKLEGAISDIDNSILLSCGYPFLIPKNVYSRAKYAINFHPTLLPKNRGKYVHHILINKDKYAGVTAHYIDENLDTGPIIMKAEFEVSPFDTVKSILRKCKNIEIDLVKSILSKTATGVVHSVPQDENNATAYFEKRNFDDSEIDPNKSLKDLFFEIRAYDAIEYPAFFYVENQKVFVSLFRKEKKDDESDMI